MRGASRLAFGMISFGKPLLKFGIAAFAAA
jgi:hypothetical protein